MMSRIAHSFFDFCNTHRRHERYKLLPSEVRGWRTDPPRGANSQVRPRCCGYKDNANRRTRFPSTPAGTRWRNHPVPTQMAYSPGQYSLYPPMVGTSCGGAFTVTPPCPIVVHPAGPRPEPSELSDLPGESLAGDPLVLAILGSCVRSCSDHLVP